MWGKLRNLTPILVVLALGIIYTIFVHAAVKHKFLNQGIAKTDQDKIGDATKSDTSTKTIPDDQTTRLSQLATACTVKAVTTDANCCKHSTSDKLIWKYENEAFSEKNHDMYGNVQIDCKDGLYRYPKHSLEQLFFDDTFKMIACVPTKTGTTTWQKSFASLKTSFLNSSNLPDVKKLPNDFNSMTVFKEARRLSHLPYDEAVKRLNDHSYKKIAHVRHPLSRLYSAWRQKFKRNHHTIDFFMQRYGNKIKDIYADNGTETHEIEFGNFVKYLVRSKSDKKFDVHWTSYQYYCAPCIIEYDFVSRTEQQDSDMREVFKGVKDESGNFSVWDYIGEYLPKQYNDSPMKTKTVGELYDNIDKEVVEKLGEVYYWDFKMFGYDLF